jgi:hypothetical protein
MQVMTNDQFAQKEVLIGGVKKTVGFKVSDDPMLMSMLSTGFYANPHRAMIQEVMFNAWDAHRMSKCQDKPIDIYISEESGFVVRDYGPGIHDQMMADIYCTYAASTKRDDEDQTGGFGLGSKSPWSYTESFTVSSHHLGTKTMYLMSRVSDDVAGKPGMTELMSFPTEETGLAVSIPLLGKDIYATYKTVKDVLYLSGIKANIYYKDDEMRYIDSITLTPSQYILDNREVKTDKYNYYTSHTSQKMYAVYGGVRYEIPPKEEYLSEFNFINQISQVYPICVGFAPHTLSPLPNREGLNLNSKTKENIRVGLELCMEQFQVVIEPLVKEYFEYTFKVCIRNNIEPYFALHYVLNTHKNSHISGFYGQKKYNIPEGINEEVWKIAVHLMKQNINTFISMLTEKKFINLLCSSFVKFYPEHKHFAFKVLKESEHTIMSKSTSNLIASWVMPNQIKKLYLFEQELLKHYPDDHTLGKPKLRMDSGDKWEIILRSKPIQSRIDGNKHLNSKPNKIKTLNSPDKIWSKYNNREIIQLLASNVVILAKTVESLSRQNSNYEDVLSTTVDCNSTAYSGASNYKIVPAYIVHSRKGAYAKALEIFKNMGFKVIEAPEVFKEKKTTNTNKVKVVSDQYHRINVNNDGWKEHKGGYEGFPFKGDFLVKPTHFLHLSKSHTTNQYCRSNLDVPKRETILSILKVYPDIAMVNTNTQANKLIKDNIKPFSDCVKEWFISIESNVYRFRNLVRLSKISSNSNVPFKLYTYPSIQKAFGVSSVKENDTKFWDDLKILNALTVESWLNLKDQTDLIKANIYTVWNADPQKDKVFNAIISSQFFCESTIKNKWFNLDDTEKETLANTIACFIRNS